MKKRIITSFKCLVAALLLVLSASQAFAGITVTLTSSPTGYTPGTSNVFTFNVGLVYTGAEYVDRYQFVFPAGITATSATPPSGTAFCGGNAGIQTITGGNIISWTTLGVPPTGAFPKTGCGAYIGPLNVFTVTANVPAGFTGPLTVTLNSIGDGFLLPAGSVDTDVATFAQILPPVPCTITCPANSTVNLAPGECNSIQTYTVTSAGDCVVPVQAAATVTQNLNTTTIDNALDCSAFAPTSQWRAFANPTAFTISSIKVGNFNASTTQIFVYSYTGALGAATLNIAQMTLLGQSAIVALPGGLSTPTIALPNIVVPAGTNFVVEQRKITGTFAAGTNSNGQTAPSYITCPTGGITVPTSYANFGFGALHVLMVLNGTTLQNVPASLVQTSGLPSGSTFPRGTTTNCFQFRNPVTGAPLVPNVSCCFSITVNEFANPIASLACNDLVQISVDANCTAVIGADQVLEGGPYGCYDDFIVELDKTLPFGNGPWVPAVVGAGDIGKTYRVRVTNPDNGNNCWGSVKIEDKLAPVLVCAPATIPCNASDLPGANSALTPVSFASPNFAVNDGATVNQAIAVAGLNPANILKVRVKVVSNHTWVGDLAVRIANPAGTVVQLFDRPGVPVTGFGCPGDGINATFDDAAANSAAVFEATCGNNPAIAGTYQAIGSLSSLLAGNPNGNWTVTATDPGFGDAATQNTVTIEFITLSPLPFPNGLVLNTNVFGTAPNYTANAGTLDACSATTLTYKDASTDQTCASGLTKIINRTWTATDASGNSSTCLQVISLLRPTLADLVLPVDYDGIDAPFLLCGSAYPTPAVLNGLGLQGSPTLWNQTTGCSINWDYEDHVLEVCDGTYKIRRIWTIIDWCLGDGFEYSQLIKVVDNVGPNLTCPANLTVSTDPYQCCATVNLPDVIVSDECSRINNVSAMVTGFDAFTGAQIGTFSVGGSLTTFPGNNIWNPDTLAVVGSTPCLPIGTHTVMYTVADDCGNTSTCTFRLTIRDFTPPVMACDEFTVAAIGLDDLTDCYVPEAQPGSCTAGGVTWIKAKTFDDGSYDNCGQLKFTIQRMAPYSDCINGLNQINGFPNCNDIFPDFPSEYERAISEGDSIKFYCCEVGLPNQMVILRAYQLDENGNFQIGPDGSPIVNSCMVEVSVQDKIRPVCVSPANVTVACETFDPSLWAYGKATPSDNCCLDTTKVYQGQCGLTHSVSLSLFDTTCNRGTITRTFRAFDCHGNSSLCTQRIVVNYNQNYWVKFPADRIVTVCDGSANPFGQPEFFGKDCELLATSYTDEVFTVVIDACYKVERTWTVINWCTYNTNLPCTYVPNPNPSNNSDSPLNLPGVTVSPLGTTQAGWAPTVVAITPGAIPTNYSTFWSANANCYQYKQIIKVKDGQDPTFAACPASPVQFCDITPNENTLWNAMYWWDNVIGSHDLCEGPTDLSITATDACSGANITINYQLFLDLDGNGTMETVINSKQLPGVNRLVLGDTRQFDFRPVPFNQQYAFALQSTVTGVNRTASVRWNTLQSPNTYTVPELPYGTHKIKWTAEDGCGNESVCEYTFVVKDCKKPTVVCINGLSSNVGPTGVCPTIWATDFLLYGSDNCTPANQLKYSVRRSGTGTGFPVDGNGNPITNISFSCADLGTQFVELWAIDKAGNADFCETYIIIQDNAGVCGGNASIAGALKTEEVEGVESANVELEGTANGAPMFNQVFSDLAGSFAFSNALPIGGNYTVTPQHDVDPLNGVTTYDLVLISRHILGLEPLNTPYKQIAADANKSNTITTFDIVELRKVILGINSELPNNTSWRFVDKSQVFTDASNPFADVIRENISVAQIQSSQYDDDFVGVKIGDVNGSATANQLMQSDDRTAGTLMFDVEDRAVKAGEEFTVNFKAADKVLGYQFTMNTNGLKVMDIVPGTDMTTDNFAVFADAITTSVDGSEGTFAVKFRASADGQLSQMLGVSSRITKAQAYSPSASNLEVALRFNSGVVSGVGFELYQNAPNPFVSKTFVGFHLPSATEATLTLFDEAGRVIYTQKGTYAKGYNAIALDRSVVGSAGTLYYTLKTTTDTATKKMIQTK